MEMMRGGDGDSHEGRMEIERYRDVQQNER
jgi:hypothetical protein